MPRHSDEITATCRCGRVAFSIKGDPIASAVCHCGCCQRAGAILGSLEGAMPVLDPDGGTPLVMYRTDHVRCTHGAEHLAEHRLKAQSPTRRIVATCCNTPMFLDFTKGHWLSWFWHPMAETGVPRPTREVNKDGRIPYGFLARMVASWAGAGFRVPKVDYVSRTLTVPSPESLK